MGVQPVGTLDDYLTRICEVIQLSPTQFNTALRRYGAVGTWLTEQETALDRLEPSVVPQGSMLQRTTIRPSRVGKEVVPFDIDTVCRCVFDPYSKSSKSLYGSVQSRVLANSEFRDRHAEAQRELGASGKCIRLAFTKDDFYLDVVPMCPDPTDRDGVRMLMCRPERWTDFRQPIETWKRTDPFRFALWLNARCQVRLHKGQPAIMASVAPVPPQEPVDVKATLRLVIQLLKRKRDIEFIADDCRPTSILLSTLAGRHYRGEQSITDALGTILDRVVAEMDRAKPNRIKVSNPADELAPHDGGIEDLAAPMTDAAYQKFETMVRSMCRALAACRTARGTATLYPLLAEMFGQSPVRRAFNDAQEAVSSANLAGSLGAAARGASIGIVTEAKAGGAVQPVPTSHFHRNA